MNNELIERLAREAGFECRARSSSSPIEVEVEGLIVTANLARFAALVAEECAKTADAMKAPLGTGYECAGLVYPRDGTLEECAAAIRAKFPPP